MGRALSDMLFADDFIIAFCGDGINDNIQYGKSDKGSDQAEDKGFDIAHGKYRKQSGNNGECEGGMDACDN